MRRSPPQMVESRLKDSNSFLVQLSMKASISLMSFPILISPYCRLPTSALNRSLSDSFEAINQMLINQKLLPSLPSSTPLPSLLIGHYISKPYHFIIMSEQKGTSLFGHYFNLHPQDAFRHVEELTRALENFADAFKERIEIEIDYSKSLLKVSRQLEKYINPDEPTPISYISSAFKVEHEQRARHALELAEYLHTEIEVPCQIALQESQAELRRIEKELKKLYKEGESVEESYQKNLKRYYRAHQDWEERMISKSVLHYTPGVTQSQKERAVEKLSEEKQENDDNNHKYLQAMDVFNAFANRYNSSIGAHLNSVEAIELSNISLQSDCIRKLIVSEVNMFKNIEYDLLNISRQMELITPGSQIECFVVNYKDAFLCPIISLYAEGPVVANRYEIIDLKCPIKRTLLEESLLRIDKGLFGWLLENKNNSTLKYAVERLLKRYEESEPGDNDFLEEFEDAINSNRTVKEIPMDGVGKERYLNVEEVYSLSLEIVAAVAQLLTAGELYEKKVKSLFELLESYLSIHHFYRFIAFLALDEYQSIHDQRITGRLTSDNYLALLRLVIDKSLRAKDIFVARSTLPILFSVCYSYDSEERFYHRHQSVQDMEIWEDRDFWEAAIFESSYELITLLPAVERSELKEVYLMRQKNVIFSGLLNYCHYMIMLGSEVAETRSIMGRLSHIYNLYEEHERDLSKTIARSYEEYKQAQE